MLPSPAALTSIWPSFWPRMPRSRFATNAGANRWNRARAPSPRRSGSPTSGAGSGRSRRASSAGPRSRTGSSGSSRARSREPWTITWPSSIRMTAPGPPLVRRSWRRALPTLGYSLAELRELTPRDLKPAHTQASFARLLAPLRTGKREQVGFSTVHRRKDGSTYPVEVRLDFLATEVPPIFVAVIQDISDRVAAEAERARLASAVEQTADSIWMQDLDNIVTYVNPSFSRVYGYEPGDIVGHHAGVIDSGDHEPAVFTDLWPSVAVGRAWTRS